MRADEIEIESMEALSPEKQELLSLLRESDSAAASEIEAQPLGDSRMVPASSAQQRLWFIDKLEGGSIAYHVPILIRLEGLLDRGALVGALDIMVRRQESLRTTFEVIDGVPHLAISPGGSFA